MKKYLIGGTLVALAFTGAACSSSTPTKSDKAVAAPKSSAPAPAPTPAPTPATTVDPVQAWSSANYADVVVLIDDMSTLATDATAGDLSASSTDCQALVDDVNTLQADGPYPDPTKGAALASALASIKSGGQACVTAIATDNVDLLNQAINDFTSASDTLSGFSNA